MQFSVRAPASSANLGPGFDALGLALDLWNTITIDAHVTESSVTYSGDDAVTMAGHENYSVRAMHLLADEHQRTLPPFHLHADIQVPVARGLGSSAAAIVSGLVAANQLLHLGLTANELFQVAARIEGHGDNVGAAMYGGAILSVPALGRAIPLNDGADLGLVAVVFIPEVTGATWVARAELPQHVPLADAAFNIGASGGIVAGMLGNDHEAIAAGMHDRLHEPPRSRLYPHLMAMTDAARTAGAVGACLSGAGPAILALTVPDRAEAVAAAMQAIAPSTGIAGSCITLPIATTGATLTPTD
ncbi:MAG TPA: homoserine kinase [Thermomicrobiales bacterium]|nr:homoserine kinase [Thermomicrobiales bacterium]